MLFNRLSLSEHGVHGTCGLKGGRAKSRNAHSDFRVSKHFSTPVAKSLGGLNVEKDVRAGKTCSIALKRPHTPTIIDDNVETLF